MSENTTLNALICRHARDLLSAQGWPDHTDVVLSSPTWPGWLDICVRIDDVGMITLLHRLCITSDLQRVQRNTLHAALKKLAGTKIEMVLHRGENTLRPTVPGDSTAVRFLFAEEWLTEDEIRIMRELVKSSIRKVCIQIVDDTRCIQAAVTPLGDPRLFERHTRHFRVIAEECDDENWLDESAPEDVRLVLAAILHEGARYGAVRLTVASDVMDSIIGYSVMTDVLRRPGEPPRRWLERASHIWAKRVTGEGREPLQSAGLRVVTVGCRAFTVPAAANTRLHLPVRAGKPFLVRSMVLWDNEGHCRLSVSL